VLGLAELGRTVLERAVLGREATDRLAEGRLAADDREAEALGRAAGRAAAL